MRVRGIVWLRGRLVNSSQRVRSFAVRAGDEDVCRVGVVAVVHGGERCVERLALRGQSEVVAEEVELRVGVVGVERKRLVAHQPVVRVFAVLAPAVEGDRP